MRVQVLAILAISAAVVFSLSSLQANIARAADPGVTLPEIATAASTLAAAQAKSAAVTEQSLAAMARKAILESLPREFSDDSDWGEKKEIAHGIKFTTENGRVRLEKHKKEVNHGLWTQYKATIVDPEQHLQVRIAELKRVGPGRAAFQLILSAHIDGEARVERWRRGLKGMNFKAEAATIIEAALDCEVALRLLPALEHGELVVEPRVTAAHLKLVDIDLQRLSKLDGPAAQEFGDRLRGALERELHKQEAAIVEKVNQAIQQNTARLHFSTDALVAAGFEATQQLLSAFGKAAPAANAPVANAPAASAPATTEGAAIAPAAVTATVATPVAVPLAAPAVVPTTPKSP